MKNKLLNKVILLVCTITLPNYSAFAEIKIATVDVARVLNESSEAKTKRTELDSLKNTAKQKVQAREESLKATEQKLKSSGASEDSKEVAAFRSQARDFSRFVKDTEEDLKQQYVKAEKILTDKALNIIKQYAKDNSIDLVLAKSARERSAVLYGTNTVDITDQILKRVNE